MKKTKLLSRDNAVKTYLWIEMIFLSMIIIFVSMQLHFTLIPLVGSLIAIRLKNDFDQFYRFVYSLLFILYLMQIYIYIRDQSFIMGGIGLSVTLIMFMALKREQDQGRTL